jgi:hypothetical protein
VHKNRPGTSPGLLYNALITNCASYIDIRCNL